MKYTHKLSRAGHPLSICSLDIVQVPAPRPSTSDLLDPERPHRAAPGRHRTLTAQLSRSSWYFWYAYILFLVITSCPIKCFCCACLTELSIQVDRFPWSRWPSLIWLCPFGLPSFMGSVCYAPLH
ncbi:hypothetical protein DEU56DRAFT_805965 [Suillus clintonianus]|uniref:uncharacterized protein n=1 Tax=Suillus clintonianus TaxID=1904413 RepID=UPI001B8670A4|nr:uncharacterized protein DEU56DRAFT_805965 [Suillus clintonianus]KAG2136005.1 hypothetical protein DEU56DRAFT_805965 [Suillus clintonianus]